MTRLVNQIEKAVFVQHGKEFTLDITRPVTLSGYDGYYVTGSSVCFLTNRVIKRVLQNGKSNLPYNSISLK